MENKYRAEAKEKWGKSAQWEAYEQREATMTEEKYAARDKGMRDIFLAFAALGADADPAGAEAQALVERRHCGVLPIRRNQPFPAVMTGNGWCYFQVRRQYAAAATAAQAPSAQAVVS